MQIAQSSGSTDTPIRCACTNLKMAARAVGRLYDEALSPAGLNSTQYAILANSRGNGVLKMELARMLMIDRTTLYRAIAVLERRGLVVSQRGGKGREEMLKLTRSGEELVVAAQPRWEAAQSRFEGGFGREWEEFLELVRRAQKLAHGAQEHRSH